MDLVTHKAVNRIFVPARENPFSVERIAGIPYRFASGNWPTHLKRLSKLDYRAAIVGRQGTGKTTLLNELQHRIGNETDRSAHYLFLPREKHQHGFLINEAITVGARGHVVLVDGVERLSLRNRFKLFVNVDQLVAAIHKRKHFPPFRMPIWIRTTTSTAVLDYVLTELKTTHPKIRIVARQLLSNYRGNVRNVLRELYDSHAGLVLSQSKFDGLHSIAD